MSPFVVLEGIDGCGKSTAAKMLVRRLGKPAVLTREPTDSWIGRAVKKQETPEISPYRDALLFMADRAQHTIEISKLLARGKLVVSDRYYHSTVAYQTAYLRRRRQGDMFDWLLDANMRISVHPDITFRLDIPPEVGLMRISVRKESSRFERLSFLREVRRNYLRLAKLDDSIIVMDGTMSAESVLDDMLRHLKDKKIYAVSRSKRRG